MKSGKYQYLGNKKRLQKHLRKVRQRSRKKTRKRTVSKKPKEMHFKEKVANNDKYTLLRKEGSKFSPLGSVKRRRKAALGISSFSVMVRQRAMPCRKQ